MRLDSVPALASHQTETATASADFGLVSCSATSAGWSLALPPRLVALLDLSGEPVDQHCDCDDEDNPSGEAEIEDEPEHDPQCREPAQGRGEDLKAHEIAKAHGGMGYVLVDARSGLTPEFSSETDLAEP